MKTIDLPPYAPTLIESTRAIGYSLEAAIADIIDNSIAANASKIELFFFPVGDEYVAILDNGTGMNYDEINTAMQYGSKNPTEIRKADDLGRFGLGLKTASLSQCKALTVITKQSNTYHARKWDVDHVSQTGSWSLLILDESEMQSVPHYNDLAANQSGTLVVWQKLDRLKAGEINFEQTLGRKMDAVREHLALVFHRYLSGEKSLNKLQITINNVPIQPADPFFTKKSLQAMDDEIIVIHGEKICVRPYILPHTSKMTAEELKLLGDKEGLRRKQGFYVYRNKRLLVWGTWFKMMRQGETSKLVRIMVDIPNSLDDLWTLDIKKSAAIPPAEVRINLKSIIDKMSETSKRTWTYRGKRETSDSVIHLWNRIKTRNGGYVYEINREHPLIAEYNTEFPQQSKKLDLILKHIEENIPLNALYLDLTNDEKIENDNDLKLNDLIDDIKDILSPIDSTHREIVLDNLLQSEPYYTYARDIKKAFEERKI